MRRLFAASALALALVHPAWADVEELTQDQRVAMLHDVAKTLGSAAACGNQAVLQEKLPKMMFIMQIGSAQAAMQAAGGGVNEGAELVKAGGADCAAIKAEADGLEPKLRASRPLMDKMMLDVAAGTGAALECGLPQDQANHAIAAMKAYTGSVSEEQDKQVQEWVANGRNTIRMKLFSCDRAKLVVGAVDKYF